MTKIKIDGSLSAAADAAIETQKGPLFANRRARLMVVAELKHVNRNQPGADEDKEDDVKLRVTFLEAAQSPKQDEILRQAMEALKLQRTAYGTLDQELQQVNISKSTLEDCADNLAWVEMARLRAVLVHVGHHLDRLVNNAGWTEKQLRDHLRQLNRITHRALTFDPTLKPDAAPVLEEPPAETGPATEASPATANTGPTTAAEPSKTKAAPRTKTGPAANGKADLKTVPEATFTPAGAPGPEAKTVELKPQPRKRAAKATATA